MRKTVLRRAGRCVPEYPTLLTVRSKSCHRTEHRFGRQNWLFWLLFIFGGFWLVRLWRRRATLRPIMEHMMEFFGYHKDHEARCGTSATHSLYCVGS